MLWRFFGGQCVQLDGLVWIGCQVGVVVVVVLVVQFGQGDVVGGWVEVDCGGFVGVLVIVVVDFGQGQVGFVDCGDLGEGWVCVIEQVGFVVVGVFFVQCVVGVGEVEFDELIGVEFQYVFWVGFDVGGVVCVVCGEVGGGLWWVMCWWVFVEVVEQFLVIVYI